MSGYVTTGDGACIGCGRHTVVAEGADTGVVSLRLLTTHPQEVRRCACVTSLLAVLHAPPPAQPSALHSSEGVRDGLSGEKNQKPLTIRVGLKADL